MQKMGHPLTEKNQMQLKKVEDKALKHPLVKEWYEKANAFYNLAAEANKKIYEGIYEQSKNQIKGQTRI